MPEGGDVVNRRLAIRRLCAAGAAVLITAGLLTGCGSDGDTGTASDKVAIRYTWWGGKDRAELIQKTIALFNKKYPNIEVKTDFQEYGDFWTKFNTQAAGGNAPDVFQMSAAFLRKYGDKNLLLDLKAQGQAGNLDLTDFRGGLEKAGEIDGKLYGVPVGANTFSVFYNVEEFDKIGVKPKFGWTWTEYNAAIKKISEASKGAVYGASDAGGVMYGYDPYLRQNGKAFFTADKQLGFTEADLKQWWGDHVAQTKAGLVVPAKKSEQVKPKSSLSAGLSASEVNWDNFLVRYASETKSKLAIAPLPTMDGKKTGQYLSSLMLSASARTKHPEEVAKFISFMTHDPEVGTIMGYNRGVLPTNAQFDAYKPEGAGAQIVEYEKAVAAAGVLEPMTPHPAGADVCEAAFLRIYGEIAQGTTTVDKGVATFFSEAKAALAS